MWRLKNKILTIGIWLFVASLFLNFSFVWLDNQNQTNFEECVFPLVREKSSGILYVKNYKNSTFNESDIKHHPDAKKELAVSGGSGSNYYLAGAIMVLKPQIVRSFLYFFKKKNMILSYSVGGKTCNLVIGMGKDPFETHLFFINKVAYYSSFNASLIFSSGHGGSLKKMGYSMRPRIYE